MDQNDKLIKNKKCVDDVIAKVVARRDVHDALAKLLEKILHHLFPNAPKIEARTKAIGSIAGKILKKYIQLGDAKQIFAKLTDLVGARAIFLRKDHVLETDEIIRKYFTVDDINTQDVGERLSDSEFGYQSHHYTIICDKKWIDKIENHELASISDKSISIKKAINISEELRTLTAFFNKNAEEKIYAELQIRTWLQHVWADLSHDVFYKGSMEIPHELKRFWSSVAAILENTDESIMKCLDQLEQCQTNGTYYIKADLDKKIQDLEIINKYLDPKYYVNDDVQEAWAAKALKKNQEELARLRNLKMEDTDNWKTMEELTAMLEKDSTHPRLLLYYLASKKDITSDVILKSLLKIATKRCDDMITSSLELPWAFAGKAFFMLFLHSHESAKITKDTIVIYDSVLRLIDLCNERSISNLADEHIVATEDSINALKKLKKSIETVFASTNKSNSDIASLVDCVKKLLALGLYAHVDSTSLPSQGKPAVIIAGGCQSLDEDKQELNDFKKLFNASLACGTQKIIFLAGGGTSGICSLEFQDNQVERFGLSTDGNVTKHYSQYSHHSINEALMEWEYLQENKYHFEDVALVGFGLGPISNLECRIALALGARVTVLRHKNFYSYERCFGKVAYWSQHPSLINLPVAKKEKPQNKSYDNRTADYLKQLKEFRDNCLPEPVMLRMFMLFKPYHRNDYEKMEVDPLVMLIHRVKRLKTMVNPEDLMDLDSWNKHPDHRLSEQHQMLSFKTLYEDVPGLPTRLKTAAQKVVLPKYDTDMSLGMIKKWLEQIQEPEVLDYDFAEREHARWYIERWLQGTRYGSNKIEKDVASSQKRNPCMVAWYDLDDDTILKDTDYLRRYIVANAILQKKAITDGINTFFVERQI